MKLIGYLRYDPAPECEGETTNTSLADQKSKIEAFCLQHNHHLILIVEEEGPSYPKERPQLQLAIDSVHSEGAEGIIVTDRNRLFGTSIFNSRAKDFPPNTKLIDISMGSIPLPIHIPIKRDPDLKTVLGLN
jgi:DNA invertase Pin-like site-specific DNA recombinase